MKTPVNVKSKHTDSAIGVEPLSESGVAPAADFTCTTRARGVICTGAGDLVIDTPGQKQVTVPLPVGQFAILIDKVYTAGSTATGVTLYY